MDILKVTCEFCNKQFASTGNLNYHKKTAKYCIKLQGREQSEFKCDDCDRLFSDKKCLNRHSLSCKDRHSNEIDKLKTKLHKSQIKVIELESKLQTEIEKNKIYISLIDEYKEGNKHIQEVTLELAKKPTTSKSTTINNKCTTLVNFPHSEEDIKRIISEKYTKSHFYQGQKGAAEFAGKHIFGNEDGQLSLTCTDTARLSFTIRDGDGNYIKDPKGLKAVEIVRVPLKEGAKKIYYALDEDCQEYFSGMFDELELMEIDSSTFRNRLACLVSE